MAVILVESQKVDEKPLFPMNIYSTPYLFLAIILH